MTTTFSHGGVLIPARVRKDLKLQEGDDFTVLHSTSGEIRLIPMQRKPRKTLLQALRALKGLKIPDQHDPIRRIKF